MADLDEVLRRVADAAVRSYDEQVSRLGADTRAEGALFAGLFGLCHAIEPGVTLEDWKDRVPRLFDVAAHAAPEVEIPQSRQADFVAEVAAFTVRTLRALHELRDALSTGDDEVPPKRELARLYGRALATSLLEPASADESRLRDEIELGLRRNLDLWSAVEQAAVRGTEPH